MDASELTQFVQQMRLDVEAFPDANVRSVVSQILNLVEEVIHENDQLREEQASSRAEITRLREIRIFSNASEAH
jgi:hypothetical protein